MRSKGFTLIELLAVIIILAIIALIAVPIVLNLIKDSRDKSDKVSVELYADSIKNAILVYEASEKKSPTSYEDIKKYLDYEGDVECDDVIIYADGSIFLSDIKINGDATDITYGEKKICIYDSESSIEEGKIGAKYICYLGKTNETKSLTFYVLEEATETKQATLIYEKNYDNRTRSWAKIEDLLKDAKANWQNLNENQINLPTLEQICVAAGDPTCSKKAEFTPHLPEWLYKQHSSNLGGYWTSTINTDYASTQHAWFVSANGYFNSHQTSGGTALCGLRPVITLDI